MSKYLDSLVKNLKLLQGEGDDERSDAWLARKCKLPKATISRVLNKERTPNLKTLEAIENGLNCRPGDMLREHNKKSLSKAELLALVDGLTEDSQIDDAIDYIGGLLAGSSLDEDESSGSSRLK